MEKRIQVCEECQLLLSTWGSVDASGESADARRSTFPDCKYYNICKATPHVSLCFVACVCMHRDFISNLLGDNIHCCISIKVKVMRVIQKHCKLKSSLFHITKVVKDCRSKIEHWIMLELLFHASNYYGISERLRTLPDKQVKVSIKHLTYVTDGTGDFVDIREEVEFLLELQQVKDDGEVKKGPSEEELWARLDELELQEEMQDERYRLDSTDTNGEDTTSSSSEEEKEADGSNIVQLNGHPEENGWGPTSQTNSSIVPQPEVDEEDECEEETRNSLPTIYFSHTVEPKKVRINTGKNTTLKFSEKKEQKEQAKRKKKSGKSNGHSLHESYKFTTPADIYRVFVDLVNGEPVPRKSILKSRSRENSVCSDTSESSTADFEERRVGFGRMLSHDEATHSDTSDGITEEKSPIGISPNSNGHFEAFTGTVIEKDPMPSSIPHLTIAPPALPTIPERNLEELVPEVPQEPPKRMSKFKATRLQQK
ncbi:Unconventional prefoldin RPB5 interactor [Triplophysa tibetana]|uniref:Unconventional prefoldin RPB5 interactor n=1 Tax=Triplophysa tibetana TaxID=1572043 RepID=A0A5A9P303_9TELE|nr:Unconventional prefoldin RPB5 interactor [Triplophysa tibetana]